MRIDVLTLFPRMFEAPFSFGIFKRAVDSGLVSLNLHNIRDFTHDKHHTVDDYTYGGGSGMVLKPEPIYEAVEAIKAGLDVAGELPVILLSPQGRLFSQQIAGELSQCRHIVLICGHYEGVDERVREHLATDEISIGDYVLTGGEIPAMAVIDAVVRLLPGVLGSEDSPMEESHASGLLEYPQYTRPAVYRGWPVPEVLLSGNHAQIASWRQEQIIRRTMERRPELLAKANLGLEDKRLVERLLTRKSSSNSDREYENEHGIACWNQEKSENS
ncbi:MAG: tRNA (guanosine(37)-N1)-methyltransferase TrmD [Chloroflexi bacterium RBG_16_50_9]|nr:MAG: tRNA (guanosine(37)-N1)-methyltransferase TrmD [Chloroflexi bacterium RBG_16_50_9]